MVGKLIKHELRALLRVLMWFMLAVVLLSVFARIFLEEMPFVDYTAGGTFFPIAITLGTITIVSFWYISVVALSVAGMITCLVRFFKSLFTGEGYLTFSLPVTPTQLLVSKFLSALIVSLISWVAIGLSVLIAIPAYVVTNVWTQLDVVLPELWALLSSEPLYITEFVLLFVAAIPAGFLYLFLVASVGQLFTKGRIIITIALYYGTSFVLESVLSILLIPLMQIVSISPHILLWLAIVFVIGFDIGSFFIIRYILNRKVNLVV